MSTNPHRGSDFNEFMTEEELMPTPRTDEFARAECCDLDHALSFARELEREFAAERKIADRLAEVIDGLDWITEPPQALAAYKSAREP